MNKAQEKYLIELGLQTLLDRLIKPKKYETKKVIKKKNKWTKAQRAKYAATMAAKFDKKNTK